MGLLPKVGELPERVRGMNEQQSYFNRLNRVNGLKGRQALSSGQRPEYK